MRLLIRMQLRRVTLLSSRAGSAALPLHRKVATAGGLCRALPFAVHTGGARRRPDAEYSHCSSTDVHPACSSTSSDASSHSANGVVNSKPIGMDANSNLYQYLLQHTREPDVSYQPMLQYKLQQRGGSCQCKQAVRG